MGPNGCGSLSGSRRTSSSSSSSEEPPTTACYIAAITKYVLVGKRKEEFRAAIGVWVDDGNDTKMAKLLPAGKNLKAALISAASECISLLKSKGIFHATINMECDYIVKNVKKWHDKASLAQGFTIKDASNWDEFKYAEEIAQLCATFDATWINWVHLTNHSEGLENAKTLAYSSIPQNADIDIDR